MGKEKLGLLLVVAAIVTNPLTGQYVLEALEMLFTQFFRAGAYVSLASGIYVCGLLAWHMYQSRERVNIPKVGNKPAGKYIA